METLIVDIEPDENVKQAMTFFFFSFDCERRTNRHVGDVYGTADKSVVASPLSLDGFAVESLAAEEIYLLRRCSSIASNSRVSEVAAVGTVPSSGKIPILLLFG